MRDAQTGKPALNTGPTLPHSRGCAADSQARSPTTGQPTRARRHAAGVSETGETATLTKHLYARAARTRERASSGTAALNASRSCRAHGRAGANSRAYRTSTGHRPPAIKGGLKGIQSGPTSMQCVLPPIRCGPTSVPSPPPALRRALPDRALHAGLQAPSRGDRPTLPGIQHGLHPARPRERPTLLGPDQAHSPPATGHARPRRPSGTRPPPSVSGEGLWVAGHPGPATPRTSRPTSCGDVHPSGPCAAPHG